METITGRVERVESKEATNGGLATVVYLEGKRKAFYDWDGKADGLAAGQTVRLNVQGDKFARIWAAEKVEGAPAAQAGACNGLDRREASIVRQCSVKASALLVQTADLPLGDKAAAVIRIACELEAWITRQ